MLDLWSSAPYIPGVFCLFVNFGGGVGFVWCVCVLLLLFSFGFFLLVFDCFSFCLREQRLTDTYFLVYLGELQPVHPSRMMLNSIPLL